MTDKSLMDLSTEVEPALTFTVDGEPYDLRTVSHLSKIEEARLRTLNKQEEFILAKIEATEPDKESVLMSLHERLFDLRIVLITMMTTLPKELVEKLNPMVQQKLINFIGLEVEVIRARQKKEAEDEGVVDDADEAGDEEE